MSFAKFGLLFALYAHLEASGPPQIPTSFEPPPIAESGMASWYGDGSFHGDVTASGESFRPEREATCAHRSLPFDTVILIENPRTGRRAWCRVNDRGPYGRIDEQGVWGIEVASAEEGASIAWRGVLDMSIRTARALGNMDAGLQHVALRFWRSRADLSARLAAWIP